MNRSQIFNLSNTISFIRLLLIIPIWFAFNNFNDQFYRHSIALIGIFAAFTDVLDGYLARKLNQITEFGKIIDPLADKVVVIFVIVNLFLLNEIPDYYFYMIVTRDILIVIGGIFVTKKIGKVLPSDYIGKATVVSVSIVVIMILLHVDSTSIYLQIIFYLSIILILVSFINYFIRAIQVLKKAA